MEDGQALIGACLFNLNFVVRIKELIISLNIPNIITSIYFVNAFIPKSLVAQTVLTFPDFLHFP